MKWAPNPQKNLSLNLQPPRGESIAFCHVMTQQTCGVPFVLLYMFGVFISSFLSLFGFVECIRVDVE